MAVEVGVGVVSLIPSARGFGSAVQAQVGPQMGPVGQDAGKKMGSGMISSLKRVAGPIAAVMSAAAVGGFLKGALDEAREAQKVTAVTAQRLKTTGNAAKVSQAQIESLAGAISRKVGIDDEAIQSSENLLLSFTNVRNEAGRGNDIFSQTAKIIPDVAAAMGQTGLTGATKAVGRALNDPIKGISALSRMGVTFSDKQKTVIKRMVETGNVAGAQRLILDQLKTKFGGTAEAQATASEKMKVGWDNLKESVGARLLPTMDRFQGFITNKVFPAIDSLFTQVATGRGTFGRLANAIENAGAIVSSVTGFLNRHKSVVIGVTAVIGTLVAIERAEAAIAAVRAIRMTTLTAAIGANTIVSRVARGATIAWTGAQWLLNAALSANPIGIVIGLLVALGVGLVVAYKKSETFRKIVNAAWDAIKRGASTAWKGIKSTLESLKGFITKTIPNAFERGVGAIGKFWDRLQGYAKKPVRFVVNTVMAGLVKQINKIPLLPDMNVPHVAFANGGVVPGSRTVSGRDNRTYLSPDGHRLDLAGGEGFLTRKATEMLGGERGIDYLNRKADRHHFARGGVFWPTVGRRTGTYAGHDGVDINQPPGPDFGAPIYAYRSGKITYTGYGRGYGNAIFEKAPGFPEVVYGHGSAVYVHRGQRVKGGQMIGRVGSTGNSSGPHLHFGVPGGSYGQALALLAGAGAAPGGISGGSYGGGASAEVRKYPNFKDPLPGLFDRVKGWSDKLAGMGPAGKFLSGLPGRLMDKIAAPGGKVKTAISNTLSAVKRIFSGGGAGTASPRSVLGWAPVVRDVLTTLGQPQSLLGVVLKRMAQESGGNPGIVNTTDSNWKRGTPSVGLMQVIGPTYRAYQPRPDHGGPYKYGSSTNPYDNIYAGLNYAKHRYGSIANAFNRPGGYDSGGVASGLGFLPKYTPKPERVLSPRQTEAFENLTRSLDHRRDRGSDRVALTITNWQTGEGYMTRIARNEVSAEAEFAATTARRNR